MSTFMKNLSSCKKCSFVLTLPVAALVLAPFCESCEHALIFTPDEPSRSSDQATESISGRFIATEISATDTKII